MSSSARQASQRMTLLYGGKRGWVKHHWFLLLHHLGAYRRYSAIEWRQVDRLLFVCSGNICRSPYTQARARALGVDAHSFGLHAGKDNPANATAVAVARQRGLDLSFHRSAPLEKSDCLPGDLLVAMEPGQARELDRAISGTSAQVTLLGLWNARPRPYLPDPYGLSTEAFEACFSFLDECVQRIVLQLKNSHAQPS